MVLVYDDRDEMQRSMKKASIREIFVREKSGKLRGTALIDSRSFAIFETKTGIGGLEEEIVRWKGEHFEVSRGEVTLNLPD